MSSDVVGLQTTISRSISLSGIGVHSGESVSITFHPADPDTGIIFNRHHQSGEIISVRAVSSQVGSTDLCTLLGRAPDRSVATVEHLMAALYALGVDNISIDLHGSEVPIMDGSAAVFIDAIDTAGLVNHAVKRRYVRVIKPVRIEMGGSWAEFTQHNGTRFEIDIDFDSGLIGRQSWKGEVTADTFRRELARARTFGFMRDVERLWASGHALGSSLENSVVIGDDDKVINVEGLRFRDEFVRHKTLDAVGDLALAGAQFIGCYRSYRGGHKLNAMALRALLADQSAYEVVEAPARRNSVRHGELVAVNAAAFAPWAV
ncbi:MAG: UDP-3-O-acyl-N-acetylglucosamine deacetylase [Hoeflea sp.]|uniref:UDP-3-O-acyl-N-acetylglucosamine deacetylase n=1 Tax=Hoeflea sp. TaxID=1940281 RepID=UPI00272EF034|nr:UDP-3-O-acyl-N-acetylglucosamine deacetylase [Hoeflea sp.]MDP2122152.1 UDP-3-O-acyl-N-acetylglucosamine deacetylase [Hoeflea sp.]MDZ7602565.1 UDP-3-O-acyl-N-acetylglucosamine deacetylase [Hoeflea sp.]